MKGIKKKSFGQPDPRCAVLAGGPFGSVSLHEALPQEAAQRQHHTGPLSGPQLPPLRLNKIGQMGHALRIEGVELELLPHLLGSGINGIEGRGRGVGHGAKYATTGPAGYFRTWSCASRRWA